MSYTQGKNIDIKSSLRLQTWYSEQAVVVLLELDDDEARPRYMCAVGFLCVPEREQKGMEEREPQDREGNQEAGNRAGNREQRNQIDSIRYVESKEDGQSRVSVIH